MTEVVPVEFVAYEGDIEVEDGTVANHDQLVNDGETKDVVRGVNRDLAEANNLDILTPEDSVWRDEFADLDIGEEVEL